MLLFINLSLLVWMKELVLVVSSEVQTVVKRFCGFHKIWQNFSIEKLFPFKQPQLLQLT